MNIKDKKAFINNKYIFTWTKIVLHVINQLTIKGYTLTYRSLIKSISCKEIVCIPYLKQRCWILTRIEKEQLTTPC